MNVYTLLRCILIVSVVLFSYSQADSDSSSSDSSSECPVLSCQSELCELLGKPVVLRMQYVGGGPDDNDFTMDEDKVVVIGDTGNMSPVRVRAVDKDEPFHHKAKVFFDGHIDLFELFDISATNAGEKKLTSELRVFILDAHGATIQSIRFHTSCSEPLAVGDQFGSLILWEMTDEDGCTSQPDCHPDDPTGDDECPNDPEKTTPGQCGCGVPDIDSDGDGVADCIDECPHNPDKVEEDNCGCHRSFSNGFNVTSANGDACSHYGGGHAFWIPRISRTLVFRHAEESGSNPMLLEYSINGTATLRGILVDADIVFEVDITMYGATDMPTYGNPLLQLKDECYVEHGGSCDPSTWRFYESMNGTLTAAPGSRYEGAILSVRTGAHAPQLGVCANGKNDNLGFSAWFHWSVVQQAYDREFHFLDVVDGNDINIDLLPKCQPDQCPEDDHKTEPGICGCGVPDTDTDKDGIPDCEDQCPNDPYKVTPDVCGCGVHDIDSDEDGTFDCNDGCPDDPNKTEPGKCGCGKLETDSDYDGVPDCKDGCPDDPDKSQPGKCGCGVKDIDSDNDGTANCNDGCPYDANKTEPGECGCGTADTDSDGDGTPDCNDLCPDDPHKIKPKTCGCGHSEDDSDHDGVPDCKDHCPDDPNKTTPGACGCGTADIDSDGDGVPDCGDDCPNDPNKEGPGVCGCGVPDNDSDGDGTPDCNDPCPMDPHKGPEGPGKCGCGVKDTDSDNDGTPDCNDNCPTDPYKIHPGTCGCGVRDTDSDNDDTPDCNDMCPDDPGKIQPGACGCGTSDVDKDSDGTPDCNDSCPDDANKTEPGRCDCGTPDIDSDEDGTFDCNDGCPDDPNKTQPGKCGCGTPDTDSDYDGKPDCNDLCPNDPNKVRPGACGCGVSDTDSDGDGTADCNDECPSDPNKVESGRCGCGVEDVDSDYDGVPDCKDGCPNDKHKTIPGECGCGVEDIDSDGDGTPNCIDSCPNDANKTEPGKCGCGVEDKDSDSDGVYDCRDGCPQDPNKTKPGVCGCGVKDTDSDNDGTPDCNDNCPQDPDKVNPGACGCGVPDTDANGDGIPDCGDECPNDPNKENPGVCGCGVPDIDTDGDGTLDCNDACPHDPHKTTPGQCGCGTADKDTDHDGIADCNDGCPEDPNKTEQGICGCGVSDLDGDGDGTADCNDGCPQDPSKTSPGMCGCGTPDTDSDGDGVADCDDACPEDPNKTDEEGTCGCGTADTDSDGDGAPDCIDECPEDANKTLPGQCGCNKVDADNDGDGVPNCMDGCPDDPEKVSPGKCDCGTSDVDTDGDGIPDCNDACPTDKHKGADGPGVCGCGVHDTDSDEDGTPDCNDACPTDPRKSLEGPGKCGCGVKDTDSDGDGTADCNDKCPNDPQKISKGVCGCGTEDVDSDYDGVLDCVDGCPEDSSKTEPGLCGCGVEDTDSDGDGIPDCDDGCPEDPHKNNPGVCGCGIKDTDSDGDGIPDCVDDCDDQIDSDGDGTNDCLDGCPNDPEKTYPGACGCGVPDIDTDRDGAYDCNDLCPQDPGKNVPGKCGCGTSDVDSDGDGTADCNDECPDDPNKQWFEECGCGVPETDTDGDGTPDCNDGCPSDSNKREPGQCGCGTSDRDSDNDGVADCNDGCPYDPYKTEPGICGCGVSDEPAPGTDVPQCQDKCPDDDDKTEPGLCGCGIPDTDSDGDGTPDCLDECAQDPHKIVPGRCGCGKRETDSDGDGTPDCIDKCPHDPAKTKPGSCGCGTPDTPTCCECWGVHVLTFKYSDFYNHPHINVHIQGNAQPSQFSYIEDGDFFSVFGTSGQEGLLGPGNVTVELFDPNTYTPFHIEHVDVSCDGVPDDRTKLSYFLKLHKRILSRDGASCTVPCNSTLALAVDVGDTGDENRVDDLKSALDARIVQKLAGEDINIALYSFTNSSHLELGYTNLLTLANVQTVQSALQSLTLVPIDVGTTQWTPLLNRMHNERPSSSTPDLAMIFVHNDPSDDLSALGSFADTLKAGGVTRIVPVSLREGNVDATKLQAVSGPLLGQDYYVAGSESAVRQVVGQTCLHLCCESDKDLCGVCFGDSSLCADCAGIPNGDTQYDVCGVCGGDGSDCPAVECEEHATVTVKEKTGLEIVAHSETGQFEFKFNTCYQPGTAVVVGFDPYKECKLRKRGTCDNRISSYDMDESWCDLFTVEYPDESVWKRTVNETALSVSYCANFTIHDLLQCKDYRGYGPLVDTVEDWKHFKGTLYGTVVRPNDCNNETECETVTIGTHYEFELWVSNKGVLSSSITTRPINFHGSWNRNIWLRSGDVIVEFFTYIESEHGATVLRNPQFIRGEESGIPYHIVNGTECTGANDDAATVCQQRWQIRTSDAHGVLDFSGIKPIQFEVFIKGISKLQVVMTLDLKIMRTRDPVAAHLSSDAWFGMYRDTNRTKLVAPMDSFIDCTHVFAKVALHNSTLPLHIDRVLVCAGSNGGDPVPFDPSHPATTGCNTPGIGIVVYTLYDRGLGFTNEAFAFQFDKEGEVWEAFWKFEAKAISQGTQLVEVHWSNDAYPSPHHLLEPMPYAKLVSGRASFVPRQYSKELYLPMEALGPNISVQGYARVEDNDDSVAVRSKRDPGHGAYSTGKTFHVICPDYQYYSDGHCVDRTWSDLYYNVWIWGLVILIPIFICIIWACCFCGDKTQCFSHGPNCSCQKKKPVYHTHHHHTHHHHDHNHNPHYIPQDPQHQYPPVHHPHGNVSFRNSKSIYGV